MVGDDVLRPDPDLAATYHARGWWGSASLAQVVAGHAERDPEGAAVISPDQRLSWSQYAARSDRLAGILCATGMARGERVVVLLPDGPTVHVAYVANEKAGLVTVGIGPRAARREIEHLIRKTGATTFLSRSRHRDLDMAALVDELRGDSPLRHHVVIDGDLDGPVLVDGQPADEPTTEQREAWIAGRRLGPDDVFMLNSTSGTTGMPKCVVHTQNRWVYFHQLAVEAGGLREDDVFMSAISAPFGFGLWTAHFTPALLGAPVVVLPRFDPAEALALIEREGVTVLAAVSTQFIMMLNHADISRRDLTQLRALFTGGEAVPYDRAAGFEEKTGAAVLQFYGSNETGALSRTSRTDSREARLRTAGRIIDEMQVRLFDEAGRDVTETGGPGQPGCKGPATCLGYYDDDEANAQLFTDDGWMLTGDIATIDDGYLRVVGRTSDFIIRGGKNISAPAVEEEVLTHHDVQLAAAVAMPDETFGERVCLYVVPRGGASVTLERLTEHLEQRGVSKEMWPEHLVLVDDLPRSSGGKVAKGELREDIQRRVEAEQR